MTKPTGFIF